MIRSVARGIVTEDLEGSAIRIRVMLVQTEAVLIHLECSSL